MEEFLESHTPRLVKDVWRCCLLNNMFWGVWALALLTPEIYAKEGIFNYDFAIARTEMYFKIKDTITSLNI
jgi:hypothetical protein